MFIDKINQKQHFAVDVYYIVLYIINVFLKPGPQSRALCGTVCALSIAIVQY